MSEHLLFLQAAGSDFGKAHDLVHAITDAMRTQHDEQAAADSRSARHHHTRTANCCTARRPGEGPERIAEQVERAGWKNPDNLLVAIAAHVTIASPTPELDLDSIASAAARIGNENLLLESTGVVFAFNTINRIADARRVRLEFGFLRQLRPIRGWVERRLASLVGLAYDMSYKYQTRRTPAEMLGHVAVLFERLGAPGVPDLFHWLSRSPVVLEGVLEMFESNITNAGVRFELLKEAAAIAVASRAMPGSGLSKAFSHLLPRGVTSDPNALHTWATLSRPGSDSDLISACRQYVWHVANEAHSVTDDQIRKLTALGLSDAELLDLTLATAVFSALAIIEPISAAVAPKPLVEVQSQHSPSVTCDSKPTQHSV